jgi:hypothetical protein
MTAEFDKGKQAIGRRSSIHHGLCCESDGSICEPMERRPAPNPVCHRMSCYEITLRSPSALAHP